MQCFTVPKYPPEPVTDLQMTHTDYSTRTVTLTWTASGDQADLGKAAGYEIRYSFDTDRFNSDFNSGQVVSQSMIQGEFKLDQPKFSGEPESITLRLPSKGRRLF